MTPASEQALRILRDPTLLQWYVIPLFVLVVYVYTVEVERGSWSKVLAGLAFYGMDWLNEIWNGLLLHLSGRSAAWTTPGGTAYLIFIGLTIEISLMFAIMGILYAKLLPADREMRILGVPNRWFIAVTFAVVCVLVEIVLNRAGMLVWEYRWWNVPHVWLIVLIGYLPFTVMGSWVHDMPSRTRQVATVLAIYGLDAAAILVFGVALRWI